MLQMLAESEDELGEDSSDVESADSAEEDAFAGKDVLPDVM